MISSFTIFSAVKKRLDVQFFKIRVSKKICKLNYPYPDAEKFLFYILQKDDLNVSINFWFFTKIQAIDSYVKKISV